MVAEGGRRKRVRVPSLSPFRVEICRRVAAGESFASAYWNGRPGRGGKWPDWARKRASKILGEPLMIACVSEMQSERRALQPASIEQRLMRLKQIWDREWIHAEATTDTATRAIKVYTELAGDMPEQKTSVHVEGELVHVLNSLRPTLGLPAQYKRPELPAAGDLPALPESTGQAVPR